MVTPAEENSIDLRQSGWGVGRWSNLLQICWSKVQAFIVYLCARVTKKILTFLMFLISPLSTVGWLNSLCDCKIGCSYNTDWELTRNSLAPGLMGNPADTSSLSLTLIHMQRHSALAPLTRHWEIITTLSWPLLTCSYSKNLEKCLWSAV